MQFELRSAIGLKQAYLIIAHKDDLTFRTLLSMLDNEGNDIFIHMDSKNENYDEEEINHLIKKSGIYHTYRSSVTWGGVQPNQFRIASTKKSNRNWKLPALPFTEWAGFADKNTRCDTEVLYRK